MKNISSKLNARLLSYAVWSYQAPQMSTFKDSDQSITVFTHTHKKNISFNFNNQPAKEVHIKDAHQVITATVIVRKKHSCDCDITFLQ